jgi:hypothetical protein
MKPFAKSSVIDKFTYYWYNTLILAAAVAVNGKNS